MRIAYNCKKTYENLKKQFQYLLLYKVYLYIFLSYNTPCIVEVVSQFPTNFTTNTFVICKVVIKVSALSDTAASEKSVRLNMI